MWQATGLGGVTGVVLRRRNRRDHRAGSRCEVASRTDIVAQVPGPCPDSSGGTARVIQGERSSARFRPGGRGNKHAGAVSRWIFTEVKRRNSSARLAWSHGCCGVMPGCAESHTSKNTWSRQSRDCGWCPMRCRGPGFPHRARGRLLVSCPALSSSLSEKEDTFDDKQSQIAERKTGDGRGPGDCSKEAA